MIFIIKSLKLVAVAVQTAKLFKILVFADNLRKNNK